MSDLPPRLYIAGMGCTDEGKVNIKVETITIVIIESIFFPKALKVAFNKFNLFLNRHINGTTKTDKSFFYSELSWMTAGKGVITKGSCKEVGTASLFFFFFKINKRQKYGE